MTAFWFKFSIIIMLITAELFLGNCGIALPLSVVAILYFSWLARSEFESVLLALFSGLVLDSVSGRSFPFSTILLLLSNLASRRIFPENLAKNAAFSAAISGAGFAVIEAIYLAVLSAAGYHIFYSVGDMVMSFLLSLIFWTLGFPFSAMVLDIISEKIGLPTYFEKAENDTPLPRRRLRRINRRILKNRTGNE